jgi:hypothetical protein
MDAQPYDRSSKWLIEHHGDTILRLAGVRDLDSWRPLPPELVQPRKLPDGLIEARRRDHPEPGLFVVEISTYADEALAEQLVRDVTLVYLDRRVLPEALLLVLAPKGNLAAPESSTRSSPEGWTGWAARWKTVRLWEIPASDLLDQHDVGLIPWVPLTRSDHAPEALFTLCRERIDADAPREEHENPLVVTQILAGLRYNDPRLFSILGGKRAMIASPVLMEFVNERICAARRADIIHFLTERFGAAAEDLAAEMEPIEDKRRLDELVKVAASCPDLAAFRERLKGQ